MNFCNWWDEVEKITPLMNMHRAHFSQMGSYRIRMVWQFSSAMKKISKCKNVDIFLIYSCTLSMAVLKAEFSTENRAWNVKPDFFSIFLSDFSFSHTVHIFIKIIYNFHHKNVRFNRAHRKKKKMKKAYN